MLFICKMRIFFDEVLFQMLDLDKTVKFNIQHLNIEYVFAKVIVWTAHWKLLGTCSNEVH